VSGLYALYNLIYSHFCAEFANFRYHGNRGQSEKFLTVTFKQADTLAPYWVEGHGLYVLNKAYCSQFCVKIRNFSLPWQQGSVWEISDSHL